MGMLISSKPLQLSVVVGLWWSTTNSAGRVSLRRYCSPVSVSAVHEQHELISWVQKQGGYVHPSIRLVANSNNSADMGMASIQTILPGSPLIRLPPHLPLAFPLAENVQQNSHEHSLLCLGQHVPDDMWALKLGLKLLMERAHVGSFWWPYISNLPQSFSIPIFFKGDEISSLQYAPIIHQVKTRCRALLHYANVFESTLKRLPNDKHPFGGQAVDASALGWAMSAVSSRAFQVKRLGPSSRDSRVMLPLIDMCNHSFSPNARVTVEDDGESFVVTAEKPLKSGTNIVLSYGSLSNDLLLLDYGFVMEENPYDCMEVRYDKSLLDAARLAAGFDKHNFLDLSVWQLNILEKLNLEGAGASLQVRIAGSDIVDSRLLAALRVLYAENPDLVNINLDLLQEWNASPIGKEIERKVLKTLATMCVLLLGHFPTTILEDQNALVDQKLNQYARIALEYRISKKRLLINCLQKIKNRINSISD